MCRISIIVPVYNGSKRIARCIDSIRRQTYTDFECIIFDDGSSDNSSDVISQMMKSDVDHRFRLITKENEGVAATRNRGIQMATGEYVSFVDQDDYLEPDYLEAYMRFIEQKKYDIISGGYVRVSESNEEIFKVELSDASWSNFIVTAPWAHMYRREFLLNNEIKFLSTCIGEDVYFNLIAFSYAKDTAIVEKNSKYHWVNNLESVSNSKQKGASSKNDPMYLLQQIHLRFPENNQIEDAMREYYFIRYCVWYMTFTVKGSKKQEFFAMEERLFTWLKSEYPNYRKNHYVKHRPVGESNKVFLAVKGTLMLRRMKLDKLIFGMLTKKD